MERRTFLMSGVAALLVTQSRSSGTRLGEAARRQLGVTRGYDPQYVKLAYPGGDVPRATGVCADVVIRAARDGLGLDLQRLVHEDMAKNFAAYPRTWGLRAPDPNIDHRRVLNLETYWKRQGAEMWAARGQVAGDQFGGTIEVGDELTWLLGGKLPHVGIVVAADAGGVRVVHNIGGGVEESSLHVFREQNAKGHFRWPMS